MFGALSHYSGKDSGDWRVDHKVDRCVDTLKSAMTGHLDSGDDKMYTVQFQHVFILETSGPWRISAPMHTTVSGKFQICMLLLRFESTLNGTKKRVMMVS